MDKIIKLFLAFLKIGAFSFGGGYAMLPLIRKEIVDNNNWLSAREFTDIIGISQATPGPIAINSATYVGYKVGNVLGSLIASFGVVIVSFILVLIASNYIKAFKANPYLDAALKGMRPALIGLILSAVFSSMTDVFLPLSQNTIKSFIIAAITMYLLLKTKIHPILIIVISALLGFVFFGLLI